MSLEITSFSVDEMLFYEYVDNMNKNVIQKKLFAFFYVLLHNISYKSTTPNENSVQYMNEFLLSPDLQFHV